MKNLLLLSNKGLDALKFWKYNFIVIYNEKRLERFMTEKTERETIVRVDNLPFNGEFVDRILKGVKKE